MSYYSPASQAQLSSTPVVQPGYAIEDFEFEIDFDFEFEFEGYF